MIEVDGSKKGGSGTILRLAIALATIIGQPLHIFNIRQKRPQPGLKPQHLEAVLTAAKLCDAEVQGASMHSRELWFRPNVIKGGRIEAQIGTAGSISMLLMTVMPICAYAKGPTHIHISKGGTDVSHAPTINYVRFVFLPTLARMGLNTRVDVQRYGYYPKGNGEITVTVEPADSLKPLQLTDFGRVEGIEGVSVATFLAERKVAERQARAAKECLKKKGFASEIRIVDDKSNLLQKGSSLVLWAKTDANVIVGADSIGKLGKASEIVGEETAKKLIEEIQAGATVDIHLADLLIPYCALACGTSTCYTRKLSEHLRTNTWLAEEILNARFSIEKVNELYRVSAHTKWG